MEEEQEKRVLKGNERFLEFAEIEIQKTNLLHQSLMEQHGALYRWILASRLAINGGAAAAMLGQNSVPANGMAAAMVCFFLGIVAAILGAEFDQRSVEKSIHSNLNVLRFWVHAKSTGLFDETKADILIGETGSVRDGSKFSKYIGNSSLVFFALGSTFVALDIDFFSLSAIFLCGLTNQ